MQLTDLPVRGEVLPHLLHQAVRPEGSGGGLGEVSRQTEHVRFVNSSFFHPSILQCCFIVGDSATAPLQNGACTLFLNNDMILDKSNKKNVICFFCDALKNVVFYEGKSF